MNKVKFNEESQLSSPIMQKTSITLTKRKPVEEEEVENKVLIDANIKVDGELTSALKHILSKKN